MQTQLLVSSYLYNWFQIANASSGRRRYKPHSDVLLHSNQKQKITDFTKRSLDLFILKSN